MNRRDEIRLSGLNMQYPIVFELRRESDGAVFPLGLINYHHRGAALELKDRQNIFADPESAKGYALTVYLGKNVIREKLRFRVCWNTIEKTGQFGVEFKEEMKSLTTRDERVSLSDNFAPSLTCQDPLDPNRKLFFKVKDVSQSGMLLSTSLSNKHLLAGMELRDCQMAIPGHDSIQGFKLKLTNTRQADQPDQFFVGVSFEQVTAGQLETLRTYLALFGQSKSSESRISGLSKAGFLSKKLKEGLTYRIISTSEEYRQLLELRFLGYKHHGKVKEGASVEEQGDGLDREGTLICAYLGGQMVASLELRFRDEATALRVEKMFAPEKLKGIDLDQVIEMNKFVIHPNVQGSDILVGMLQKAHAVVMARGARDVLCVATDQLANLYARIGFKKVGIKSPHPVLLGVFLHVMILHKATYMSADGINPHAWALVFEATQRHLEVLGVAKEVQFTRRQKVVKRLSALLCEIKARKKKKSRNSAPRPATVAPVPAQAEVAPAPIDAGGEGIPPQWTAQHMVVGIILPYIFEADRMIGAGAVDAILKELRIPRQYFLEQGNWVSVKFLDAFLDRFAKFGDLAELSQSAGERSLKPDMLGAKYFILKHLLTPDNAFKAGKKILPKINSSRTYEILECRPGKTVIRIGVTSKDLLPKHRESCLNFQANFLAYITLMTGRKGQLVKHGCCYDGADACTYEITWVPENRMLRRVLALVSALALGDYILNAINPRLGEALSSAWVLAAVQLLVIASLIRANRKLKDETARYDREFEEFEVAANNRYLHLQNTKNELSRRYSELLLLEETASSVLRSNELSEILRTTLDSVCSKFGFRRAFVMLTNESRTTLRTASIAGVQDDVESLWRFAVDVTVKRENMLVLSSVFHSGRSVLIRDVDQHLDTLNEASRRLIQSLGAKSFALVAIPATSGNWGVIVADRALDGALLQESDVQVLERLAHHLGIALDKQARLDSERRNRALFEKFVPAYAKRDLLSLGWEERETIAMFVDIRSYTEISSKLPPTAIASIVNGFYELVHTQAKKFNGYTDKYIGDGALVTWGYLDPITDSSEQAVLCAISMLEELGKLNAKLAGEGIAPLEIGLGIHRGRAVCGLFGCEERMEFTGIGSTLNAASRLQGLCKDLGASLVVSDRILDGISMATAKKLHVEPSVRLRGVPEPMRVGYLPAKAEEPQLKAG